MDDSLYNKLSDITLLRRGWHLARSDARNEFIADSFRYNDFAFDLDKNLHSISSAIIKDQFYPKPILNIDFPKSTLAVRPGTALAIEDKVVLFAIEDLIATKLDKELPDSVYS